jgi:hypothetical protein
MMVCIVEHARRKKLTTWNFVLQRPFPLKGRYYANVFIHFEPVDSLEGKEFVNEEDEDLPPYILANSPEASNWLAEHDSWTKVRSFSFFFSSFIRAAGSVSTIVVGIF